MGSPSVPSILLILIRVERTDSRVITITAEMLSELQSSINSSTSAVEVHDLHVADEVRNLLVLCLCLSFLMTRHRLSTRQSSMVQRARGRPIGGKVVQDTSMRWLIYSVRHDSSISCVVAVNKHLTKAELKKLDDLKDVSLEQKTPSEWG